MNGNSLNIVEDRLNKLQKDFPEIFSEGKIDLEKFKATFSDDINFNNERYVLNWAGKSDAFKVLQIPTTATLQPQPDASVHFETTENVFIEGENLEVLKVLQKSYYGKIKCIIIDPPYNTGNDSFIYPDSFKENKADYEKRVGDKDEEGYLMKEGMFRKNSKDSGHYHSNWLSMIYPRLFLAKNLLREDGVIFVHIDDNEVHNLRMVMNEIFGEENFIAQIVWQKKYGPANDAKYFSNTHEYVLSFARNLENWKPVLFERDQEQLSAFKNPDNDPRGDWRASDLSARTASDNTFYPITLPSGKIVYPPASRSWIVSEKRFQELVKDNRIWFGVDGNGRPMQKKFLSEVKDGITPQTWWDRDFADDNKNARYEIKDIFPENVFDTPKPTKLIKRIIEVATNSNTNDIVLDFFSGSATTAHSTFKKNREDNGNRKFILVQLPELCDEASEAFKAGYKTIADISRERIRRAIQKIETEQAEVNKKNLERLDFEDKQKNKSIDLGFKSFKLAPSNFKIWQGKDMTAESLVQQLEVFTNPVKEGVENEGMIYELILKAGYLLTDEVEGINILWDGDSSGGKCEYYKIAGGELIIVLSTMDEFTIEKILEEKPKKVITLDLLFTDNDQLKTNTVLQMKDAGIDFKTI